MTSNNKPKPSFRFEALGTQWYIACDDANTPSRQKSILDLLAKIDATWSRFRDDSIVADMARRKDIYTLHSRDVTLLNWYKQLYDLTNGSVTPLIGNTLEDSGYDANYSLIPRSIIRGVPAWDEILSLDDKTVTIKEPSLLDVGAAGKGFAVDEVATLLDEHAEIDDYIIDASGDMRVKGSTHVIGLEHPRDPHLLIGTYHLKNRSLCGSSSNRRAWGEWHHIINPQTSRPTHDVIATWAIADNAMHADGLATALFFVEPEKLISHIDFEYVIMYKNGSVRYSKTKDLELFVS